MSSCLDDDALAAWHEGRLEGEALLTTRAHVDSCDACQQLVAAYEGAFGDEEATKKAPERYRQIDILGAGAMGIVHRAHDSELDREVALKVLRAGIEPERLVREARAMAKLRHANVVTVFDAGRRHDGTAFVAMELVDGSTLREWLANAKRSTKEIVRVFAQAADALATAHAMLIVHRDFKPDNVLVTKTSGDAKVADFGLAGLDVSSSGPLSSKSASAPLTKLTKHGAVIGTPAYMAPEQHDGKEADARADQFAFFVSLFEALTGTRPFPGDTPAAVRASIARGVDRRMIERLPRELRDLVATGLKEDPKRRHPSMAAVAGRLRALSRDPSPRRWVLAAPVSMIAVIAAGVFAVRGRAVEQAHDAPLTKPLPLACVALRSKAALSDADKKAALEAFTTTKLPFASDAHGRFVTRLDAYVKGLDGACGEDATAGEIECLELLRTDATNVLRYARKVHDRAGVEGAIVAARALEPPAICRGAMSDTAGHRGEDDDAAAQARQAREDPEAIARMLFELRTVVAPPTPSMAPPATKRGLLSLMRVLRVRVHEPNAFEQEAEWDDMNETFAALPGLVKQDIEEKKRSADRAAEIALGGRADAGVKAVKKNGDPVLALLTRAIASATQLHLEALRAEALVLRSEHVFEDPTEEVLALVSRAPRLAPAIELLSAHRMATTEGRLPRMGSIESALRLDLEVRSSEWAEALLDRGELVRDRGRPEIDSVIATADDAWGSWHSRSAQARVQAAEWLALRGVRGPARENAATARDVLKDHDARSSSRRRAEHAALHARALVVLALVSETTNEAMTLLQEAERAAPKSSRPSHARARILLDRVHEPNHAAHEAARAQGFAEDAIAKAEANALLAEATAAAGDRASSGPLFAQALATVSLLSPPDRARLRLAAARRLATSGDLGVARALAEQAEADDPEAARTLLRELKR